MSSTITQVLLRQLHLYHCLTLGLLLIEITIMCAKLRYGPSMNGSGVFKMWYDSISGVGVLDDVTSVVMGTDNVT